MIGITCLKTGCHAYVEEYDQYVYGDAYSDGRGLLVLRCCAREMGIPVDGRDKVHVRVQYIAHWFDDDKTSMNINSTLLSRHWTWYGYDGKEIELEQNCFATQDARSMP